MDKFEALVILGKLGHELRTQDNRMTRDPVFCVQVQERFGPLADGYEEDGFCFYDAEEGMEIEEDDDLFPELIYQLREGTLPRHITPYNYRNHWTTVQTCLTQAGADQYLKVNGHNLRRYHGVRVHVDSFYRNREMVELREAILALTEVPND